jgi:uncharacterized protein
MTDSRTAAAGPMPEAEIDRLAELLDRYGDPDTGLNIEALDGYLSALAVAPTAIAAEQYLPGIWGEAVPSFAGSADEAEAQRLIARLSEHVHWRLRQPLDGEGYTDNPDLMPLMLAPESDDDDGGQDDDEVELPPDFPLGAVWAFGFMRAVELDAPGWEAWCDRHEALAEEFGAIFDLSLVDPEQMAELGLEGEAPPDLDERQEIVDGLPSALQSMLEQRRQDLAKAH